MQQQPSTAAAIARNSHTCSALHVVPLKMNSEQVKQARRSSASQIGSSRDGLAAYPMSLYAC